MDFKDAVALMKQGKKLTHRFFTTGEWVTMEGNEFIFEDGVRCSLPEFISHRIDLAWNEDWIVHPESKAEDEKWKELETQLIDFLRENEDKILPMPTPIATDIVIFLKSKVDIAKKVIANSKSQQPTTEWTRFEDKQPKVGDEILVVWPSGLHQPEYRLFTEEMAKMDWGLMRWLPIPTYKP